MSEEDIDTEIVERVEEAIGSAWLDGLDDEVTQAHQWLGKYAKIWFQDKKNYFVGSIWEYLGNDEFYVMWGNHRKEKVELLEIHCYGDCTQVDALTDNDRWSFIV